MAFSTLTGVLELDTSGVSDGVNDAEDELDSLGSRVESAGGRLRSAGTTMTAGITAPLTAMGALSVNAAAGFDQAMQQSIAVMGDVDDAMRDDLETTAREVANTTTISADQAAEAYYFLASAGLDAAQAMEAMPEVAAFAEAGQMDMAEATDVATNVMSAFGYGADEMSEVTDTLTATVSNHNQTMEGMSTAMSQVAPIAASLGLSIEETSAAIGQMGDVGIQGERAGTALRNVMSQLSDEGSTVTTQLEEMGVSTRNSQGEMVSLTELLQNMERAGVEAGDAASIFGTEAGPAMAALMQEGSDALAENTQQISEAEGATEEMAETQRDTLNAELAIARSNLEDVGIAIGADLLPMLSTLTGYASNAAEWFQGLNDEQRQAIIVAGGLVAAIGPLLLVLGTIGTLVPAAASGVTILSGAVTTLTGIISGGFVPALIATNVALGPITVPIWAIIAALGALVAIVYGAYRVWRDNIFGVRDVAIDAFDTVREWLDMIPGWLLLAAGPLGQMYYAWRENLFGVRDLVSDIFGWIGEKIDWLIDKIGSIPGIGDDLGEDAGDIDDAGDDEGDGFGAAGPGDGLSTGMGSGPAPTTGASGAGVDPLSRDFSYGLATGDSPEETLATDIDAAIPGDGATVPSTVASTADSGRVEELLEQIRDRVETLEEAFEDPVSLESGRLEFDRDGLVRIVDGRISRQRRLHDSRA